MAGRASKDSCFKRLPQKAHIDQEKEELYFETCFSWTFSLKVVLSIPYFLSVFSHPDVQCVISSQTKSFEFKISVEMSFLYGCLPKFLFDSGDEISNIFHHFMGLEFVVVRNTSESKCWLGHLCLEKQYNLGIFPSGKGQVPFPNLSLEQRFLRMDVPLKKERISTSKGEVEGTSVTSLFRHARVSSTYPCKMSVRP